MSASLLRCSFRGVPRFVQRTAQVSYNETLGQKIMRWADITGFFTRWNSRKQWLLNLDPADRAANASIMEFERKADMIKEGFKWIFLPMFYVLAFYDLEHLNHRQPMPQPPAGWVDANRKDWYWHSTFKHYNRCNECRFADLECRKECFDKVREAGFEVSGYNRSRVGHFFWE